MRLVGMKQRPFAVNWKNKWSFYDKHFNYIIINITLSPTNSGRLQKKNWRKLVRDEPSVTAETIPRLSDSLEANFQQHLGERIANKATNTVNSMEDNAALPTMQKYTICDDVSVLTNYNWRMQVLAQTVERYFWCIWSCLYHEKATPKLKFCECLSMLGF